MRRLYSSVTCEYSCVDLARLLVVLNIYMCCSNGFSAINSGNKMIIKLLEETNSSQLPEFPDHSQEIKGITFDYFIPLPMLQRILIYYRSKALLQVSYSHIYIFQP